MTDRIPLDHLTSDQLDQLYERVATAEQEADASVAAATHLTTLVGKRSEKAERTAEKQRRRAEIAERELHVLRTGLRAAGGDPTQIQNLWAQIRLRNQQWQDAKQRTERAEAAITRIQALADRWDRDAPPPGNQLLAELRTALDQPARDTTATQATETTARIFAGLHRSAEQDVTRVIDLYEQWVKAGPPPLGTPTSRWWDKRLVELHHAIRPTDSEEN